MGIYEDFAKINSDYNKKLFDLFRNIIDTAICFAMENNMDPLDRYVYVNSKIESAYKNLACAKGIISNPDIVDQVIPPIDDSLMEKIYSYVEPLAMEAREQIQKNFDQVMQADNIGELMERLERFQKILDMKDVSPSFYEDVEIKKRV